MKVIIPDNWNQVTIEKFSKLPIVDVDHLPELISVLTGEPIVTVNDFSKDSLSDIIRGLHWVFEMPDETFYKKELIINDKDYFLMNLSDLTIRDWTDLIFLIKDHKKNLNKIVSILYRHEGNRGDAESFKNVMVGDIYGTLVFFSHIEKKYLQIMNNYLMIQVTTMMKEVTEKQTRRSRGMNLFTRWRKVDS